MKRILHQFRLFLVALQFLTRVPVPAWVGFDAAWLQQCLRYFPLIGALVGLGGAVCWRPRPSGGRPLWPWA
jgi:adenosylcobinamide-GDP ribazoletransferase